MVRPTKTIIIGGVCKDYFGSDKNKYSVVRVCYSWNSDIRVYIKNNKDIMLNLTVDQFCGTKPAYLQKLIERAVTFVV